MKLADELIGYIHAAYSGLWIETHEPDEAEREIVQLARQQKWRIAVWDIANGLRLPGTSGDTTETGGDPMAALRALPALADKEGSALLVLHNFHRLLGSPDVVQTTFSQLIAGKQQRTFVVVLAPTVQIPLELEKLFVVIQHALPDREQLQRIAQESTADKPSDFPRGESLDRLLDAAAGLTRYEAEGAFALSLARHNALRPGVAFMGVALVLCDSVGAPSSRAAYAKESKIRLVTKLTFADAWPLVPSSPRRQRPHGDGLFPLAISREDDHEQQEANSHRNSCATQCSLKNFCHHFGRFAAATFRLV